MKNRGNIILSLLLLLALTLMGLGLMTFTNLHIRIRQAVLKKDENSEMMRRELLPVLHRLRARIFSDCQEWADKGSRLSEYFNTVNFPETGGELQPEIRLSHAFKFREIPKPDETRTHIIDKVSARWPRSPYTETCETIIETASGKLPLTGFSFFQSDFLKAAPDSPPPLPSAEYLREKGVMVKGSCPPVTGRRSVVFDSTGFLMNCLEIQGTALTWAALRQKFGFPASQEPIPPGIHLLTANSVLTCIFIQGDVDRLIFSTGGAGNTEQYLEVVLNGESYFYSYTPGATGFRNGLSAEPWLFRERLAVNGDICSVEQEGDTAFTAKTALLLYSPGEIRLTGGLRCDQEQLILRKMKPSCLTLVCAAQELMVADTSPRLLVESMAPVCIDAAVLCAGITANTCSALHIRGGLFCFSLENSGQMTITGLPSFNKTTDGRFHTGSGLYVTGMLLNALDEE